MSRYSRKEPQIAPNKRVKRNYSGLSEYDIWKKEMSDKWGFSEAEIELFESVRTQDQYVEFCKNMNLYRCTLRR